MCINARVSKSFSDYSENFNQQKLAPQLQKNRNDKQIFLNFVKDIQLY